MLLRIVPLIAAGLLIGGFIQVLVPHDLVSRWLGENSGLRGIAIATAAFQPPSCGRRRFCSALSPWRGPAASTWMRFASPASRR